MCTPMNQITRYHNELNTVPMRKWTAEEQNFFFAIITQVRDKGDKTVKFNKSDLVQLVNYSQEHNKRFNTTMAELKKKVNAISYTETERDSLTGINKETTYNLFEVFSHEWTDDLSHISVEVKVSDHFQYVVNKLEVEFTQFELKQFTSIRSNYAKEMFKKLKQWRTVGKKQYSVDEFRDMLQVPKSYRAKDVSKVILKPIQEELSDYFQNLKITPIKGRTKGNPITAYCFTWTPEETGTWNTDKYKEPTAKPTKSKVKKENLPEWANNNTPATETPLTPEAKAKLDKRIASLKSSGKEA